MAERGSFFSQQVGEANRRAFLELDRRIAALGGGGGSTSLTGPMHITVKNTSGSQIGKGYPVYATGSVGASGAVEVSASRADTGGTMPALGLLDEALDVNAQGSATVIGVIRRMDTSSYSENDELYVAPSGGLTDVRPTSASDLVQKIGRVVRAHAQTGEILVLGAGRANDVPNNIVAGGLTIDTDTLHVDSTNNRVGIGTTSPSAELDIKGASNPEIRLQSTDSSDPFLYFGDQVDAVRGGIGYDTSANALQLRGYNNSTRMTIDSSGNVGIGTTTPAYKLDVAGDIHISNSTPYLIFTDTDTNAESRISASSGVGSLIIDADYNNEQAGTNIVFKSDGSERMRINSSGNVGIGTTTPQAPLGVDGDIDIVGAGRQIVFGRQSEAGPHGLEVWDSGSLESALYYRTTPNAWSFENSSGTDILTVDIPNVRVGINDSTPSYSLDVNGTFRSTGAAYTSSLQIDGGPLLAKVATSNDLRVTTPYGYIDIGPKNSSYCHIYTDRNSFYTNKPVNVAGGSTVRGNLTVDNTVYAGTGTSSIDVLQIRNEVQASNGSASDPSYTFSSDGDTGMYRQGTNSIGFATGGIQHYWNGNGIYLANGDWFRTTGNSGWYSQTHSGGIYMIDTTWVRVYNNKAFYTGSGNLRTDGQLQAPNMSSTTTYNTVRWNSNGSGQLLRYSSTADIKDDVVSITPIMEYLNERSLIYDLRPVLFHEKDQPDGTNNTRGEYIPGLIAEEVLEVAPELCFYDENGNLISYGNDHLIPHLIAEIQRMMPMVESLYADANPDWVAPTARPVERASGERTRFDEAAAAQALVGRQDISDPLDGQRHLEDETTIL